MNKLNKKDLLSITEDGVLLWNADLYVETIINKQHVSIYESKKTYRIGFDKFNFDKVEILLNSMRWYFNCGHATEISYEYQYFDIDFGILEINVIGNKRYFEKVNLALKSKYYKRKLKLTK